MFSHVCTATVRRSTKIWHNFGGFQPTHTYNSRAWMLAVKAAGVYMSKSSNLLTQAGRRSPKYIWFFQYAPIQGPRLVLDHLPALPKTIRSKKPLTVIRVFSGSNSAKYSEASGDRRHKHQTRVVSHPVLDFSKIYDSSNKTLLRCDWTHFQLFEYTLSFEVWLPHFHGI